MSASKAAILEAVELLASQAEGGLEKKPSVKDLEALVGGNVTAADRDEAWEMFVAEGSSDDHEAPEVEGPVDAEVVNNYTSPLAINGVTIPVGGSAVVPKFNAENPLLKRWLEKKVISVEQ